MSRAHFFTFDIRSALSLVPLCKAVGGTGTPTEFSNWSTMQNHNVIEKTEVPLGEKFKKGWEEFNILQHNINMCSHYSVQSYVSVSFMPGLEKISLRVISMEGVKAFK